MKKFPFSELMSEMHPLVLHNLNLIRLWNDYNGIKHTLTEDTIQIKTQILGPLKSVIPSSFIHDEYRTGDFKMSYYSDYSIRISENPETLIYQSDYAIVIQVTPIVASINHILKDPKENTYGLFEISTVDPTIGVPDDSCEISPVSETTLSKLIDLSRQLKFKIIKYFRSLATKAKNKKFAPKNVRNKIYQQMELIDILQQSFMELNDPDLIVLIPPVAFSRFHAAYKPYVSSIITWVMLDVHQSIKINHVYRAPYEDLSEKHDFVLGWRIHFWV